MKIINENRKARFNYFLLDAYDAGIVLTGSEVKSIRANKANIVESYVAVMAGELWIQNMNIPPYTHASKFQQHDPTRLKKLLLRKKEIIRLSQNMAIAGLTIIPYLLYFNTRNLIKIRIYTAKGKKIYDKRQSIKEREWKRNKKDLY